MRCVEALKAAASERSRVRLDACAGAGSGAWCTVIPTTESTRLTDAEFLSAMRWRLGLKQATHAARCIHFSCNLQKLCGSLLDPFLDHAVICKKGGGVYRLHNCLAQIIREFAKEAGCEAQCETTVPSLLKGTPGTEEAQEARLDVHIWAGGAWPLETYVDVTTRHPWAQRYRQESLAGTQRAVTSAERRAESQKDTRYAKAADGVPVVVAVLGSWGRLSDSLSDLLDVLSRRAAHLRTDSGVHAASRKRRWIEEIAVAQQRCLHRQFATAMQTEGLSPSTARST